MLERIPDYEVRITPVSRLVSVFFGDQLLAQTRAPLLVEETRHNPVYYFPRQDVRLSLFGRTDHRTYCPFKGDASYWQIPGEPDLDNVAWSYETPYPEVAPLKDHVAFYTDRVTLRAG